MVNFVGEAQVGDLVQVDILEAGHHTLRGAQVVINAA
jgi:hypothetical protein